MNWICKIFGHKRREWIITETDYKGESWGRWAWLRQCPRCGEELKIVEQI